MGRFHKVYHVLYYFLGLTVLALGLTLNTKTGLGVSPVTSLPYAFSQILDIDFGDAVFVSHLVFIAVELILKKQKTERILILLQIPLGVVFTRVMNLFGAIFNFTLDTFLEKLIVLFFAIVCAGVGTALILDMQFIPTPGTGVLWAISETIGKDVGLVKNIVDLIFVTGSFMLGWFFGNPFLSVGFGTVLGVLGVGRTIAVFDRFFQKYIHNQAGLS